MELVEGSDEDGGLDEDVSPAEAEADGVVSTGDTGTIGGDGGCGGGAELAESGADPADD